MTAASLTERTSKRMPNRRLDSATLHKNSESWARVGEVVISLTTQTE